ncbi:MAG: hypothetical protein ACP5XB_21405 [Isosphaeraceae bacterium]
MFRVVRRVHDWFCMPDDEQYVERVRKSLRSFDRCRWFLAWLHGLLLVVWLGLAVAMTILMQKISAFLGAGNFWGPAGFLIGMMLGIPYALGFVHYLHGLLNALVGLRNERLMIRYHDALATSPEPSTFPSGRNVDGPGT